MSYSKKIKKEDLHLVEIRKSDGTFDGTHFYTFLTYAFIAKEKDGNYYRILSLNHDMVKYCKSDEKYTFDKGDIYAVDAISNDLLFYDDKYSLYQLVNMMKDYSDLYFEDYEQLLYKNVKKITKK